MALADSVGRLHDRDPLVGSDLVCPQVFVVNPAMRWSGSSDPVGARHGDVDRARKDVAELIEVERRLMRKNAAHSPRPQYGLHKAVQRAGRRERKTVDAVRPSLQLSSFGHSDEVDRINSQPPRVVGSEEAVLLVGQFG